ncbi:MAG: hypothetical protein JSU65_12880 [Candidatus Zixiibacteriota bacterium]|nr:MAG: hypothetical protein JSU65_12880 [candidate division Zixibacteria bacterium]
MRRIHNIRMAVFFVALMAAWLGLAVSTALAAKVQIPEGTEVKVKFPANLKISSGVIGEGIPLLFYLHEDITIGGKVIVEKGAEGTASVTESVKASKPGKPGKITLEFVDLAPKGPFNTLDESRIKLTGSITEEGGGKKILSYLFIFGLFIKGGQGEISPEQIYTATVAESVILED